MTNPDVVRVTCRSRECAAQYDQHIREEARWSDAIYAAALPAICGVCGSRSITVTNATAVRRT